MLSPTTHFDSVLDFASNVAAQLSSDDPLKTTILQALKWVNDVELPRLTDDERHTHYISEDPTIALLQSAFDETNASAGLANSNSLLKDGPNAAPMMDSIPALIENEWEIVEAYLAYIGKPRAELKRPKAPDSIGENTTLALCGDWATGFDGARRIASQIINAKPEYAVHLGDTYPAGTDRDCKKQFINIWNSFSGTNKPPLPKFRAMMGNHEMICKAYPYYDHILPFCKGQTASYFVMENTDWKIIALDTAYDDHDLEKTELEWFRQHLEGAKRKIILSHHQLFSVYDVRPSKKPLMDTVLSLKSVINKANVVAWFWGHEHGAIAYEDWSELPGIRFRSIGNGGKRTDWRYHQKKLPKIPGNVAPPIKWVWATPENGYVLLRFNGPTLSVQYRKEDGQKPICSNAAKKVQVECDESITA
jgi:hypothetical protein